MIEMKCVPCSNNGTLQRYMDTDAKGILIEDTPWNAKGVPPLITDDKLEEFVEMCSTIKSGMTHCKSSPEAFIESKNKAKLEAIGNKGVLVHSDSNKNEWIYCDLAVGEGGFAHTISSHRIKAAKSNPQDKFHLKYPMKDCNKSKLRRREGLFGNLQWCAAIS